MSEATGITSSTQSGEGIASTSFTTPPTSATRRGWRAGVRVILGATFASVATTVAFAAPAVAAPVPAVADALVGYVTSADGVQHVVYVGSDEHVHELYYNGRWWGNDLTHVTSSPKAMPTALDGYVTSDNVQHVDFVTSTGHVRELYYNGRWWGNDLTKAAGATTAKPYALDGYTAGSAEFVDYVGTDNHIHELFYNGGGWYSADLSMLVGGVAAFPNQATRLVGFVEPNGNQDIDYVGANGDLDQLTYAEGSWWASDLSASTGAPQPLPASGLDEYFTPDGIEHVDYVASDDHVHELYLDNLWYTVDLTAASGAPNATGLALDGYATPDGIEHVNFISSDDHVHELYYTGGQWWSNDLTNATSSTTANPGAIDGYVTPDGVEHVDYVGYSDNNVHELYDNGSWWGNTIG